MAMLPMPQSTGRPIAATMPLATSGKQQLIRRLCGETCASVRATRDVKTAWKTAVALNPPSETRRPTIAGPRDNGGRLKGCGLHDDGGAQTGEQLGDPSTLSQVYLVALDRDRAREHFRP